MKRRFFAVSCGPKTSQKPGKATSLQSLGRNSRRRWVQSLTEARTGAMGAELAARPDIALAAVVHAMARSVFHRHGDYSSLQLRASATLFKEVSNGEQQLKESYDS